MPAMRLISNISQANEAIVTTTFAHGYLDGEIVRFYIPERFGMQQINEKIAPITILNTTQFSVPIDTTLFDPYATPALAPFDKQCAQVVPIGEISSQIDGAIKNVLREGR